MKDFLQRPEIGAVTLKDAFWTPYTENFRDITIPYAFDKFFETKAFENFVNVEKNNGEKHVGNPFDDGLILETITGASNFLNANYNPEFDKKLDELIEIITSAQQDDGYLHTIVCLNYPEKRWGENGGDIVWQHDLYNHGALIEAGVAHYKATGKTSLLLPAIKAAALICSYIGEAPKHHVIPGHSLPELAFIELHRLIKKDEKVKAIADDNRLNTSDILELVRFWYDNRGNTERRSFKEMSKFEPERWQNIMPFAEMRAAMGHAVRAGLCYAGAASYYRETQRADYLTALNSIWKDIVNKKMHISGGIGSRADIEGFDMEYQLQNDAYLETCAGIALAFFAAEMALIDKNSAYFDIFELSLYNNILGSMGEDMKKFYYDNPLVNDGTKNRWSWHSCPCCPPMLAKIYSSLVTFIYSFNKNEIYVNMYLGSTFENENFIISQNEKQIIVEIKEGEYDLNLRIPSHAQDFTLKLNGQTASYSVENGYASLQLKKGKATITVEYTEKLCEICASDKVEADRGKICYMRGNFLYCAEGSDNGGKVNFAIAENANPIIRDNNIEITTKTGEKALLIPYYKRNNRVSDNQSDSKMTVWFEKEGMPQEVDTKDKLYACYKIY